MLHPIEELTRKIDALAFNRSQFRAKNIVAKGCRNGDEQAHGRGDERLGDARRHGSQRHVFHLGNGLKGMHDAPDRAKKADKGSGIGRGHQYIDCRKELEMA